MATEQCENHNFENAEGLCGQCARPYCSDCLIFAFGPKKPPLCKSCAIAAAGIRKNAGRAPAASRREIKRIAREHRREAKQKSKPKVDAGVVSADMDWSTIDAAEQPRPAPTSKKRGSAVADGMAAGLGFDEEPVLHEVRPRSEGELSPAQH